MTKSCQESVLFMATTSDVVVPSSYIALLYNIAKTFVRRYRKGQQVAFGRPWYGAHAQVMVVASEAVLPLAITAIFATNGDNSSSHARRALQG